MNIFFLVLGIFILAAIFWRRYQIVQRGVLFPSFFSKEARRLRGFHMADHSHEITVQEMIPQPDTINPRDALKGRTLLQRANQALTKGDSKNAEKLYIQSIAVDPSLREAYGKLGIIYLNQQQFSKAEMIFRRLVLDAVKEASHLSNLGLALYHQNKLAEARTFYEQAIELDASRAGRFFSLGKILHELNEFELALQHFQKATAMEPRNVDYLLTLAQFYQERKMLAEGQRLLGEILELFPNQPEALRLQKTFERMAGTSSESLL